MTEHPDSSSSAGRPTAEASAGTVAGRGLVMAVGALASRATGFVRTAAIGAAIGAGLVGDAYATAVMLPGILYEVLLGGTVAGILVPLLVRARDRDADGGVAHAQRLLTLGVLVFAAAAALAVAAVPLLVAALSTGHTTPAGQRLVAALSYLVLPALFFYGLGAVLTAVLNARGHFAAPTWSPILNNVVLIGTAGVFLALPGPPGLTPETITPGQVMVLGGGTLLGVIVQTAGLWPAARRVGLRWRWRFDLRALQLGQLGRLAGWMLCYVAVSQVGVFVVIALAKAAGDRGAPGTFIYSNGWLMLMMGYGIAALPIITALMPNMSTPTEAGTPHANTASNLAKGTRLIILVLAPATAGFIVLGQPIAVVMFAWHRYTLDQALSTGVVIAVAGACLIPYAISQLQTFAFYATSDAKTPALLNIPVVALRIAIDIALFLTVPVQYVAAALMAGNGLSYLAAVAAGSWLIRRRGLRRAEPGRAGVIARAAAVAGAAALVAAAASYLLGRAFGTGKIVALAQLAVGGTLLLGGYLAIAHLSGIPDVVRAVRAVRHRLPARLR